MSLRILYVSGTYHPATSGAEVSARTFLEHLAAHGCQVLVLTGGTSVAPGGSLVVRRLRGSDPTLDIIEAIREHQADVVVTQQLWSDVALRVANECGVPSVLRSCRIPCEQDVSIGSPLAPTEIFTVSTAAREDIAWRWGREAHVIPPPFDSSRFLIPDQEHRSSDLVLMFNPVGEKGGNIFREVAAALPDRAFGYVPGWQCLRGPDGTFDHNLIRSMCVSLGARYDGTEPVADVPLADLTNVTRLAPQDDVWRVLTRARLVLIPSVVDESFGRVAVEAAANGIPVLASPVGGLADVGGRCGSIVEPHLDPDAWIAAIRRLDEPRVYEAATVRAVAGASRFIGPNSQEALLALLQRVAGHG